VGWPSKRPIPAPKRRFLTLVDHCGFGSEKFGTDDRTLSLDPPKNSA